MNILNKIKDYKQHQTNEEGFTLIELMIVVVIIGILAAIAIPIFMNQQKAAHDAAVKSDLKNIALAFQTYQASNGKVPTTFDALVSLNLKLSDRGNYTNAFNYMLVCTNVSNNYAVYATSQSGTSYVYASLTGKIEETTLWPVTASTACPAAGVPNVPPSGYFRWSQDAGWLTH